MHRFLTWTTEQMKVCHCLEMRIIERELENLMNSSFVQVMFETPGAQSKGAQVALEM